MKILVFGHIPTWAGGRQEHGLANVIYNLALSMSEIKGAKVVLAATDVYGHDIRRDNLLILGWRKADLMKFMLCHLFFAVWYFLYLFIHIKALPHNDSIAGVFFKGLFLRSTLLKENYDILHLHEASSWYYVIMVPKRVKIVVTFHGPYGISEDISYHKKYAVLERKYLCCKRISSVCFISHTLAREYKKRYKNIIPKICVILNAFDNSHFRYIKPRSHVGMNLCTIGTLQPRKGQMRVAEGIFTSGININYYTIGAGSKKEIERISTYCRENHVNYKHLGILNPDQIREALSRMDFMILPSSSEGFGLVFPETIACGIKVVLPKNLPIVEENNIIKPGINSLLLEDSSSESIKKVLSVLLVRKDYNHKNVSESLDSCTWQDKSEEYMQLYISLKNA